MIFYGVYLYRVYFDILLVKLVGTLRGLSCTADCDLDLCYVAFPDWDSIL